MTSKLKQLIFQNVMPSVKKSKKKPRKWSAHKGIWLAQDKEEEKIVE